MRSAEIALLLVPFIVLAAWLYGIRGLSRRGTLAAVLCLAAIAAILFWLRLDHGFRGPYVPAHLDGTHVLPGHPA